MLKYKRGNIFSEDVEALVNTVNCVGVMGRGLALQFKKIFPENFKSYAKACKDDQVCLGKMFLVETGQIANPKYIINFPTKKHWREKSRIEDIETGLNELVELVRKRGIQSIAIPPLGSGLGGLSWIDVRKYIERAFAEVHNVDIIIFEPSPTSNLTRASQETLKMTSGQAALIKLMEKYQAVLLDPFITLLEVHKLMYFMQEAGEPLNLKYKKAPHGPYAENLRHVMNRIEGHFISGYYDGGDQPQKPLEVLTNACHSANIFLQGSPDTLERSNRVIDLIRGFESAFGLELLASIHWVLNNEAPKSIDDIINYTYSWSPHKRRFSTKQIKLASNILIEKKWAEKLTNKESIIAH